MSDKLKYYHMGWEECYFGIKRTFKDKELQKAYDLGWQDYILGDDVKSLDYQTDEQIIARIDGR